MHPSDKILAASCLAVALPAAIAGALLRDGRAHSHGVAGDSKPLIRAKGMIRPLKSGDHFSFGVRTPRGNLAVVISVLKQRAQAPDGASCLLLRSELRPARGSARVILTAVQCRASGSQFCYGMKKAGIGTSIQWNHPSPTQEIIVQGPLRAGQRWSSAWTESDGTFIRIRARVGTPQRIRVPAGEFAAFPIYEICERKVMGSEVNRTSKDLWFVPALGVAARMVNEDRNGTAVEELTGYHLN